MIIKKFHTNDHVRYTPLLLQRVEYMSPSVIVLDQYTLHEILCFFLYN